MFQWNVWFHSLLHATIASVAATVADDDDDDAVAVCYRVQKNS